MKKAQWIKKRLDELYPDPKAPLVHTDAYTLLIAVLLSAQCTDERVNRVTPALFRAASNPKDMVGLGQKKILELIRSCGLAPQKSKAIHGLSQILLDRYGAQVPGTFEDLESLPGVGHKTASVVMSQWFHVPAFPVDTHIHRLAKRWGLSSGKNVTVTEADLKKVFPKESWNRIHLQMIFYGREYCTARGCDGSVCEICQKVSS